MAVSLRRLTPADYEAVHELDLASQREYRGPAWDRWTPEQREACLWYPQPFPADLDTEFCWAACDGERLVGFLIVFRESPVSPAKLRVDGIAVEAEYRREGVATALYRALVQQARDAGIRQLQTRISLDNEASQRLHELVGFELLQRVEATLTL